MNAWIVVNIGCIECGVDSAIVGVFDNEAEANRVAGACNDTLYWRQGGQNRYEVFPMPTLNVIAPEYAAHLKAGK